MVRTTILGSCIVIALVLASCLADYTLAARDRNVQNFVYVYLWERISGMSQVAQEKKRVDGTVEFFWHESPTEDNLVFKGQTANGRIVRLLTGSPHDWFFVRVHASGKTYEQDFQLNASGSSKEINVEL